MSYLGQGWHQQRRKQDARAFVFDVWDIYVRLGFWQIGLADGIHLWADGRCLGILLVHRHLSQRACGKCRHLCKVWLLADVTHALFRNVDARTFVFDIWNIRLFLRQLWLVYGVDGRANLRCNRADWHLRFHVHRLFGLLRLLVNRWSLRLWNL